MSLNIVGEVRINRTRLERLLRLPGGLVHRNLTRRVRRVEEVARRLAPGSMNQGIESEIQGERRDLVGIIRSTHPATIFVLHGTGIHGPKGQRIRPVRARALRFVLNGRVVYATSVSGQKPNNFLAEALRSAL